LIPYKFLWKSKLPQKIKIFFWLVVRNKILTKDNLKKRNWNGFLECRFCGVDESIDHLFFHCPIAKYMWRVIQVALNLRLIPSSISNLYNNWLCKQKTKLLTWFCLVVELYSGLFGALEMIGALEIKICLILLTSFFFAASSWTSGLLVRKKEQKMVVLGSKLIRKTTSEAFGRAFGWCPIDRRISGWSWSWNLEDGADACISFGAWLSSVPFVASACLVMVCK
jgi:hypothetical protein